MDDDGDGDGSVDAVHVAVLILGLLCIPAVYLAVFVLRRRRRTRMELEILHHAPASTAAWMAARRSRRADAVLRAAQEYQERYHKAPVMPESLLLARMKAFGVGTDPASPYFGVHFRTRVLQSLDSLVAAADQLHERLPGGSSAQNVHEEDVRPAKEGQDMDSPPSVRKLVNRLVERCPGVLDKSQCERCLVMYERVLAYPDNGATELTETELASFEQDLSTILLAIESVGR
ncbi:hypothetical protein FVE85_4533 [Porphyridium purpureum]|uniref:Transmembrane protein n=1 Tax=Porphyridium purpureum TaxID=35688 RepID=A0A5J4YI32_PORPP|nr:hypothetical protein FVE85_4533 [Porphyridium purpureum]|eukprot:POR0943..scf297_16